MYYFTGSKLRFLKKNISELAHQYQTAKPFPHIVFKNFLSANQLARSLDYFPNPSSDQDWWQYDNVLEKKFAKNDLFSVHARLRTILYELMDHAFVSFLEELTGIPGLIVDHTLNGGGLHCIRRGGKLDIHADYNYHPVTKLDRRLNVLLYLNPEWNESWGGHLELWDADMERCEKKIAPLFNRLVIFSTTDTAFHGHPDPLDCPEDVYRKSIALYYYSNGRPESERTAPHSTVFKRRPFDPLIPEHEELRQKRSIRRIE